MRDLPTKYDRLKVRKVKARTVYYDALGNRMPSKEALREVEAAADKFLAVRGIMSRNKSFLFGRLEKKVHLDLIEGGKMEDEILDFIKPADAPAYAISA